jgi:hypothetical protein
MENIRTIVAALDLQTGSNLVLARALQLATVHAAGLSYFMLSRPSRCQTRLLCRVAVKAIYRSSSNGRQLQRSSPY